MSAARTVSIFGTERGTVRGVVRAAAGAYDRESCCMDSIVRTCEAEAGAVGAQWKQFLRCLPLRLGRCCVLAAMRVHGRLLTIAHSCPCSPESDEGNTRSTS